MMTTSQVSEAKNTCPKCGVVRPYCPQYENKGLCSRCKCYEDSDKYLGGYRWKRAKNQ